MSPLRRATDAVNVVRSSDGMPTSTTRPPGRVRARARSTAASSPAHSIATSTSLGLRRRVDEPRAGGCRGRGAMGQGVAGHDVGDARGPQGVDDEQPDRTAAEHGDARRRVGRGEMDRVERDPERLEDARGLVVDGVGERLQQPAGPGHPGLQAAIGRVVAGERGGGAQLAASGSAGPTRAARDGRLDDTRRPASCPSAMTAATSCPRMSGRVRPTPPIEPSRYQCRSEPHKPTTVTSSRASSGPTTGAGTGSTRRSRRPWRRAARPRGGGGAARVMRRGAASVAIGSASLVLACDVEEHRNETESSPGSADGRAATFTTRRRGGGRGRSSGSGRGTRRGRSSRR